jgi:hypothetical protein
VKSLLATAGDVAGRREYLGLCVPRMQYAQFIGMYGPPPCRKRKVRIAGKVCAYVYGLVGVYDDSGPGWNALRSGPN